MTHRTYLTNLFEGCPSSVSAPHPSVLLDRNTESRVPPPRRRPASHLLLREDDDVLDSTSVLPRSRRAMSLFQPRVDANFLAACREGNEFLLRTILQRPLSLETVNQQDRSGRTGLSYACSGGHMSILLMLADLDGLDVNLGDNEGNTPLMIASQAGHSDVVSFLIERFKPVLDIDQRNIFGMTALMKAALQGRSRCVKVLLSSGANPNLRDPGRKFAAIDWANLCGRHGCSEAIEKYISKHRGRNPVMTSSSTSRLPKWPSDPELVDPNVPSTVSSPSKTSSGGHQEESWLREKLRRTFQHHRHKTADLGALSNITTTAMLCASSAILHNLSGGSTSAKSSESRAIGSLPKLEITPENYIQPAPPPKPERPPPPRFGSRLLKLAS